MKTQSISISVAASRDQVFNWLAAETNLSLWLGTFCQRIQKVGTWYRAATSAGEMFLAVKADAGTGVLDLLIGAQLDEMSVIPLRVLSRPRGAAVVLTFFQETEVATEIYRQMFAALLSDMRALVRRFGGGELHLDGEVAPVFYPNLVTGKFYETWDFYTSSLNFRTLCECDAYVHLQHDSGAQLGLLKAETDGVASELVSPVDGRGFWLSIHVPDADTEYERLDALGVEIVEAPCNRGWGMREFTLRDPNGVLIRVAHVIPSFVDVGTLVAS